MKPPTHAEVVQVKEEGHREIVSQIPHEADHAAPVESKNRPILAENLNATQNKQTLPSSILAAYRRPFFDIPRLIRDVTLVFVGALVGLFVLDAWIVARKKVVRVSGHTVGHMAFFLSLAVGLSNILPGSIV